MGGPDRPWGWAEQCSRQGLCLKERRGRGVISGAVRAVRERVADGCSSCCHCRQVSRYDLCGQRVTLALLPQNQFYLVETGEKTVNTALYVHRIERARERYNQDISAKLSHKVNVYSKPGRIQFLVCYVFTAIQECNILSF